jgi:hypothetical protein
MYGICEVKAATQLNNLLYKEVFHRSGGKCEICGKSEPSFLEDRLELHHILRRKVDATVSNCVMLCVSCHRGMNGVHGMCGHKIDLFLKLKLQDLYYSWNLSEDEVRKAMGGKIYIEDK